MEKKLTSEQILKLPKEDFIKYMQERNEEFYNNLSDLGDPNYFKYTFDEKVGFWCESLNRQMRIQVEGGWNEYNIYSPLWYKAIKRLEPDFDTIMDEVFNRFSKFNWEWRKDLYLLRIKT